MESSVEENGVFQLYLGVTDKYNGKLFNVYNVMI